MAEIEKSFESEKDLLNLKVSNNNSISNNYIIITVIIVIIFIRVYNYKDK